MSIPIRNLYYLFCYAWEHYQEGEIVDVGLEDCPDLPDLFARLLIDGTNRLLRRGLDRDYQPFEDELRSPRGRMLIGRSIQAQTQERGTLYCLVDELRHDVLHNQLIKATAALLARDNRVSSSQAHRLRLLIRRFGDVSDIRVAPSAFGRVQLSRNTGQYRRLLRLCEFVWLASLPEEGGQGGQFGDILRDEIRMSQVFQEFLLAFYRNHAAGYRTRAEDMRWRFDPLDESDASMMPIMRTDIVLRSNRVTIVIDAKFYAEPFPRSGYGSARKIRSDHLFQLYAYMRHAGEHRDEHAIRGALIYASPSGGLIQRYNLDGHDVTVAAIDLSKPWSEVHESLLKLV